MYTCIYVYVYMSYTLYPIPYTLYPIQFLQQTNLRQLFSVLVCAEDVTHHKPHPEPFLAAAKLLGANPQPYLLRPKPKP